MKILEKNITATHSNAQQLILMTTLTETV